MGVRAPLYSFWGVPGTLSDPSWTSLGLPWLHPAPSGHSLGRTISLWSFRADLALRRDTKVWEHTWAQPRCNYTSGGVSGAHSASWWALWSTPDAPLGTSSALLERGRCNFGVFLTYLAFGPVSVLQGRGRNVGSVHAGACFVRVRKVQQYSLLRHLWGLWAPKIGTKRARGKHERARVAPESRYLNFGMPGLIST